MRPRPIDPTRLAQGCALSGLALGLLAFLPLPDYVRQPMAGCALGLALTTLYIVFTRLL